MRMEKQEIKKFAGDFRLDIGIFPFTGMLYKTGPAAPAKTTFRGLLPNGINSIFPQIANL